MKFHIALSIVLLSICFLHHPVFAAEAADPYAAALSALRASDADPSRLGEALKSLAAAAEAAEKASDTARAAEINALIYWAHKRMTLADLGGDADVRKRLERVSSPVESSADSARLWLDRADAYAKDQPDALLVAIRYFEVADRFKDSDVGRKAMESTLKAAQRAIADAERKSAAGNGTGVAAVVKPVGPASGASAEAKPKTLDLARIDYDDYISAAQWDGLKTSVVEFTVNAKRSLDTGIDVTPGMALVLLPHPTDRWHCAILRDRPEAHLLADFRGKEDKTGRFDVAGALTWRVGSDPARHLFDERIQGSGRLYLQINDVVWPDRVRGELRVKVALPAKSAAAPEKPKAFDPKHPDYDHYITAAQWESVVTPMFHVQAKKPCDTGIDITPGQQFVLLPHPDDKWWVLILRDQPQRNTQTDFKGYYEAQGRTDDSGKIVWRVGKDPETHLYDVTVDGAGRLYIQMNVDGLHPEYSKGEIRVKIVKVK